MLHALLIGLLGAGIVHIGAVLAIPTVSRHGVWDRLAALSTLHAMAPVGPDLLSSPNPLFVAAACRFVLEGRILHVRGNAGESPFWSLSIYNRRGQNVFSINHGSAADGVLDVAIAKPGRMSELRKGMPPEFEHAVFVETDLDEGIVLVRALVPDETWRPTSDRLLESLSCAPV